MRRFRAIRKGEIAYAKMVLHRDCPTTADPDWKALWVKVVDGRITGFFGVQHRYIVEPAWAEDIHDMEDICTAADNYLGGAGIKQYEFTVQDSNREFQVMLETLYGIEGTKELPCRTYQINRETTQNEGRDSHRKIVSTKTVRKPSGSVAAAATSAT